MSENGAPKLYLYKPKKGHLKQVRGNAPKDFSPQQVYTPPPPPPSSSTSPPTSAPVKESFVRRYKYLWPLLLTVNLVYGAYLYKRIKKQRTFEEEETAAATGAVSTTYHPVDENSAIPNAQPLAANVPVSHRAENDFG